MDSISEYFESMFKDAGQSRHKQDVDDPVVKVNYYRLTVGPEDVKKKCDPRLFFTSVLAYTVSKTQSTRYAVMAVEHNGVYAPLSIDCRIQRIDRFFSRVLGVIVGLERMGIKEQKQIPECYNDAFKFTFFEKDTPLPKDVVIGMSISEVSGSYELIVRSRFFPEEYIKAFMMIFDGYANGFASCSTIDELSSVEYVRNQTDLMMFQGLGYSFENGCPLIDAQKDLMKGTDIDVVSSDNIVFRVDSEYYAPGEKIKEIFMRFIDTHPLFRVRLSESNGEYRMIFPKYYSIPIWRCDPKEIESTFRRRCDVRNQPLTRIEICDWEGKITIFIEMHMVAFDIHSLGRMMDAMNRLQNGEDIRLDDGIIRQAVYESTAEQRPLYMLSKAKYDEMLKDAEIDCLNVAGRDKIGMSTSALPLTVCRKDIDDYAYENDLTANDIFTAAFASALSEISGKDRCLFYNTVSGRSHIDIKDAIGAFTRQVPFSVSVKDRDISDVLCDVSYLNEQMEQCDIYPLWKYREENGLRYDIVFSGIVHGLGFYLSPDCNVRPIGTNRRMLVESVNFNIIYDDERYAIVGYTDIIDGQGQVNEVMRIFDRMVSDMIR